MYRHLSDFFIFKLDIRLYCVVKVIVKHFVRKLLGIGLVGMLSMPVSYAAFTISPIRVDLTPKQKVVSLQVTNTSVEDISIQVNLVEWKQEQEKEFQDQISRDVLVTPPIFKVEPQQTQILRLGLRRPFDATKELSYRLFLKEIEKPLPENFQGFRMIQQVSLPVFVQPQQIAQPQLQWRLQAQDQSSLKLSVENVGTAHSQMTELSLKFKDGEVLQKQGNFYVLPQGVLSWMIPKKLKVSVGESVELSIITPKQTLKQQMIIEP